MLKQPHEVTKFPRVADTTAFIAHILETQMLPPRFSLSRKLPAVVLETNSLDVTTDVMKALGADTDSPVFDCTDAGAGIHTDALLVGEPNITAHATLVGSIAAGVFAGNSGLVEVNWINDQIVTSMRNLVLPDNHLAGDDGPNHMEHLSGQHVLFFYHAVAHCMTSSNGQPRASSAAIPERSSIDVCY